VVTEYIKKKQHYIFPVLDILLNGLNYFYHVYVSWYLTGEDYGELNALLSVAAILLVTGISFQMATARKVAASGDNDRVFKNYGGSGAGVLLSAVVLLLPLSPFLAGLTRSSVSSVFLVILLFSLNLVLSIYRGLMQGQKRFLVLNISFYVEVLSKTVLLFLLLPLRRSVNAAMFTIAAGMMFSLVHSLIVYRKLSRELLKRPVVRFRRKTLIPVAAVGTSQFALYFFTSVDMIIVNYFLIRSSGVYAVVLKYCQLLFFVSFSIMTVFIPHLSEQGGNRKQFLKLASLCTMLLCGIGVCSLIFYWLIFPPSVTFFFDQQYADAAGYLLLGGIGYFLLVLSFMLINFMLVLDKRNFIPPLVFFSILLVGVLVLFKGSIRTVLLAKIAVFSLLLAVLTGQTISVLKKEWVHEQ